MKPLHPFEDWQLSAHGAGDLPPDEAAAVAAHLAQCAECRARQAELIHLGEKLRSLPPLEPSRDLWPAIAAAVAPAAVGASRAAVPAACAGRLEEWRLSAYLDGDLDSTHRQAVESHLEGCGACRARLGELREMVAGLHEMPALEPSPFLWARIQAGMLKARDHRARRFQFAWTRWVPAGAAVAAALAAFLWKGPLLAPGPVAHRPQPATVAARTVEPANTGSAGRSASAARTQVAAREVLGEGVSPAPASRSDLPVSREYTEAARAWIAGLSTSARSRPASQIQMATAGGLPSTAGEIAAPDADPSVTEAIRAHLEQLDANIRDTQTNLALNPGSDRVQAAAWAAYMAKIEYLRSILNRGSTSQSRARSSAVPSLSGAGVAA